MASAIGGALGILGGGLDSGLAFLRDKKARDFAQKMYKHRYQYTVQDMKLAGLNPILAATGGFPGAPGVSAPGGGATGGIGASSARGVEAGSRASVARAQTRLLRQQTATNAATELKERNTATLTAKEIELLEPQIWSARARAAVDSSNMGQTAIRANRAAELALESPRRIKDLVNPFSGPARRLGGRRK